MNKKSALLDITANMLGEMFGGQNIYISIPDTVNSSEDIKIYISTTEPADMDDLAEGIKTGNDPLKWTRINKSNGSFFKNLGGLGL